MKLFRCLTFLCVLCVFANAQQVVYTPPQQPVTYTLTAQPVPVSVAGVSALDGNGPTTYCYWLVANFSLGKSAVAGPFCVQAPSSLVSGNRVTWNPVVGALNYDVLKSSTIPTGACNCAVATAVSGTSQVDTGGAPGAYTVSNFNPNLFNFQIQNRAGSNKSSLVFSTPGAGDLFTFNSDGTCSGCFGAGVPFNSVSAGTNINALLVGTGGSLGSTGSGSITATAVPFSGVTTGTSATTLHVGTGGTLDTTGSGNINATAVPFSGAASGTNTNALLIGTGGSLGPTGSGTVTANGVIGSNFIPDSALQSTGVSAGSYSVASISVNANGRLTVANNGTGHNVAAPLDCIAASASGTHYTCTTSPSSFTPGTGDAILFKADVASNSGADLAVNGATAAPITTQGSSAIAANGLLVGQWAELIFDGTNWQKSSVTITIPVTPSQGGTGSTALPSSAQILIGNGGGTAYAPQSVSGDGTLSNAGVLNVTASHFAAALPASQGGTGSTSVPSSAQIPIGNGGGTAYAPQSVSGDGTLSNAGVLNVTASHFASALSPSQGGTGNTVTGADNRVVFWLSNQMTNNANLNFNSTTGIFQAPSYSTTSNCASSGGTCGSASAGRVSIAAATTTVTVATTAVTANSEIFVQEDSTLGTALSVTCNTGIVRSYQITTRTPGTSFVISSSVAPITNPACLSWRILN